MKRGISLIALLVTIAVILTLVSTIVIIGTDINNNTKKVKFASEISYVEEILKTYFNGNGEYPVLNEIDFNTENLDTKILFEQFSGENIINNNIKLYKIDFSKMGNLELTIADKSYNDKDSVFLFSKTTGRVYYKKGYKVGRKIYYTLTDELKKLINYVENNNVNDGIIFSYNDENSPKNKVSIDIKIPSTYTNISITSDDQNFVLEQSEISGEYYVYKTVSNSNSTITINYEMPELSRNKTLKYNVSNVDNIAPSFNISDIITMENSQTNKSEKYIKIIDLSDNISGVKCVKYANNKVEENTAKEYFKNNGIELKDDIIILTGNGGTISIYVEDNAGNFSIKYIDF